MVHKEDAPGDRRVPARGLEIGAPVGKPTSIPVGAVDAAPMIGRQNGHGGGVKMTPQQAIAVVPPAGTRSPMISGAPAAGDGAHGTGIGTGIGIGIEAEIGAETVVVVRVGTGTVAEVGIGIESGKTVVVTGDQAVIRNARHLLTMTPPPAPPSP